MTKYDQTYECISSKQFLYEMFERKYIIEEQLN